MLFYLLKLRQHPNNFDVNLMWLKMSEEEIFKSFTANFSFISLSAIDYMTGGIK
jgi:hypothetical protein